MSNSKKRKPSLIRTRTLRRGCNFRPYEDSDLRWFWAAYQKGAFDGFFDDDMDQETFTASILTVIAELIERGNDFVVFDAEISRGTSPVGIVTVGYIDHAAWPHVAWFPWASMRNKVECSVLFLKELKKEVMPLIAADEKDVPFFSHLARYGLLRRVGSLRKYRGKGATLYQGVV